MRKNAAPAFNAGLSLIEVVISVAIFALLMMSVYEISALIVRGVSFSKEEIAISALADQYLEIARNLPYSSVGTVSGNPSGSLPDLPNATSTAVNKIPYQIYYAVSYVDDPADGTVLSGTDPAPNDYKQIKLYVKNTATAATNSFLTNIVPKGLENMSSGGALAVKVFDAVGQPVHGATIQIKNASVIPNINLYRTSGEGGNWIEVGLPSSAESYRVIVTKDGYSSDQTYPVSEANPNPAKPDATIASGEVTQIGFSIDRLSNLTVKTLNQFCGALSGTGLAVRGEKLIGTPDLPKFYNTYSSGEDGKISLPNIEWDNYTPALTGATYMIYGSSPIQQINLMPNTVQTSTLILGPNSDKSILVIVKDSATGNPIEGARVELKQDGSEEIISKITGGSVWSQNDWSGGGGQENFSDAARYLEDSGTINTREIPLGLRLAKAGNSYASFGSLTSSSFDTGTDATAYTTLTWQPTSQNPATGVEFQIAANNDNATWNYAGPDGTPDTFYSVPGTTINPSRNNNRYLRYKVFLETGDPAQTPVLSSVEINYVSGCFTPGQAMFTELPLGYYALTLSADGYQTQFIEDLEVKNGYNVFQVLLNR